MNIIFALLFAFAPFVVSAHATPVSYDPAPGVVLSEHPQIVSIRFNERIEESASSIRVFDPSGAQIDIGGEELDRTGYTFSVAAGSLMQGTYSVAWQVLSADDGHITKGAYAFSFGTTSAAAVLPVYEQERSPVEGFAVGLELLGSAFLLGLLVIRFVVWKGAGSFEKLPELFWERSDKLATYGALSVCFGGALYFASKALELGSGFMAFSIFAGTAVGFGTVERVVSALLFLVLYFLLQPKLKQGLSFADAALLFLLLASTFVRTQISHAAASAFMPELSVAINFIHLFWKEVWVGGVICFAYLLLPLRAQLGDLFEKIRKQFSRTVLWAFLFGGVSGTYVVWLHLKSFENILATLWGQEFVLLSTLAFFLVLFRLLGELLPEKFPRMVVGESVAAGLIAMVTGFIIITTPPLGVRAPFSQSVSDRGVELRLVEQSIGGDFLLSVMPSSFNDEDLVVQAFERRKDIGPLPLSLVRSGDGSFLVRRSDLVPAGQWTLSATLLEKDSYDAHATFVVDTDVPLEDSTRRSFDFFGAVMLATVVGVCAAFFVARKFLR